MTTYLVLKHTCTFQTFSFTTNAAGQKVPDSTTIVSDDIKCSFLYLATNTKTAPVQEDEDIVEVIIGDDFIPEYKQHIVNIKDRYQNIIETGPLEIIGIKKYAGYVGKLHHYRIRTRKMKSC